MIPNSDGYVPPSFSRLPPPFGDIAREQLARAFRREPPFQDIPRSSYDLALSAMPPPEGLTSEEFRRLCWEDLNAQAFDRSDTDWQLRQDCLSYADRKMAFYLAVNPMLGASFRLTRRLAKAAVGTLVQGGEMPTVAETDFEFGGVHVQVEELAAGIKLRLKVWSNYGVHPMIDSKLQFITSDPLPVAFAIPHRIFFERTPAIPTTREEFGPLLGRQVRHGRSLQTSIAQAFAKAVN